MVKIKDLLFFLALMLLLLYSYLLEPYPLLIYIFLIIFFTYSFISLAVSRKYGANVMGWSAVIKYRDYTSLLLNFTQLGLIFNVFFLFYVEKYQIILVIAGFVIMFAGMGFNLLVRRELGKNWVPLSKTTQGQELVTSGIYSKIRHPFYTSIIILFLGVALMALNFYALLFYLLFIISILVRIKKEEEELIDKFGDEYLRYKEEVGMLFPGV